MSNKEVNKNLTEMMERTEDQEEKNILERSIRAVSCYRNCKNCVHRVVKSKYAFCEIWDCDYEPKPEPVEVGHEVQ